MLSQKIFIAENLLMAGLLAIICLVIGCGGAEKTSPLAPRQQTLEVENLPALALLSNETHIWPGNDFQGAVDEGGKVYVHGEWNFEVLGIQRIEVGRQGQDVEIIGVDGAKIIGGFWPIYSTGDVGLAVKNLTFEDAVGTVIGMSHSAGLKVIDCTIQNMQSQYGSWAVPVCISPVNNPYFPWYMFCGSPAQVHGNVEITNNSINANIENFASVFNVGVLLQRSSANCLVSSNTIYGGTGSSIFIVENPGSFTIKMNSLYPGDSSPHYYGGSGVWLVSWGGAPLGNCLVTRNTINCSGNCYMGLGYGNFWNWSNYPTVTFNHNKVHVQNCYFSVFVTHGLVSNTVWAHNEVTGNTAGVITSFDIEAYGGSAKNNMFQANNISHVQLLDPQNDCHILFDTGANNNTVVGFSGSVTDLGINNIITGHNVNKRPLTPKLGQRLKEAKERMNELKDMLNMLPP